jgi:hypothetical protein
LPLVVLFIIEAVGVGDRTHRGLDVDEFQIDGLQIAQGGDRLVGKTLDIPVQGGQLPDGYHADQGAK